jgi:molybdate transport system ATP-binding protein
LLSLAIQKHFSSFSLDVSLAANAGELVVLFGASGAGKSLTLQSVAGLFAPDAGRISIDDRIVFDASRKINLPPQARHIALVTQDLLLFPHLTVAQNIAYGLPAREPARADELIELVQLRGFETRLPAQLSGGQQQRVALARALATRPRVLLLDEPFSSLDAPTRAHLRHEFRAWQKQLQVTTLFVSHDLGEAYFLADRLAVIAHGTILQFDAPGELMVRPRTLDVARAVGVKNILTGKLQASDCVRIGEREILVPPQDNWKRGEGVHVCIRPERVLLIRPERAEQGERENEIEGELTDELSDGMNVTLSFCARGARLRPEEPYDLQIDVPVYIYERLDLHHQREWAVSLRSRSMHLIRAND